MPEFRQSKKPQPFSGENAIILVKSGEKILINSGSGEIFFKSTDLSLSEEAKEKLIFIGTFDSENLYALDQSDIKLPSVSYKDRSELLDSLEAPIFKAVLRSFQLLNWDKNSRYCSCCGGATHHSNKEFVKLCEKGHRSYPQYSPSMIVVVTKGNEMLLGRSPGWKKGLYSPLAGFLEAGETGEEAVAREVMEEVGIKVKNIRPFSTKPHPFPNSLMLGYTAEYESGELTPDPSEIEDAKWFNPDKLPILPNKSGIAYELIQEGRRICNETKLVSETISTQHVLVATLPIYNNALSQSIMATSLSFGRAAFLVNTLAVAVQYSVFNKLSDLYKKNPDIKSCQPWLTHPITTGGFAGALTGGALELIKSTHYHVTNKNDVASINQGSFFNLKNQPRRFLSTYAHTCFGASFLGIYPTARQAFRPYINEDPSLTWTAAATSATMYGLATLPQALKESANQAFSQSMKVVARHLFFRAPVVGLAAVAAEVASDYWTGVKKA